MTPFHREIRSRDTLGVAGGEEGRWPGGGRKSPGSGWAGEKGQVFTERPSMSEAAVDLHGVVGRAHFLALASGSHPVAGGFPGCPASSGKTRTPSLPTARPQAAVSHLPSHLPPPLGLSDLGMEQGEGGSPSLPFSGQIFCAPRPPPQTSHRVSDSFLICELMDPCESLNKGRQIEHIDLGGKYSILEFPSCHGAVVNESD